VTDGQFPAGLQKGKTWHFSILRPVLIVGLTIGGAMDLIPPLASMPRCCASRAGHWIIRRSGAGAQAVDVDLLARAIAWSGEAEAARNQAFNVTMATSSPGKISGRDRRCARHEAGPGRAVVAGKGISKLDRAWDGLRRKHNLIAPDLESFVGLSFQYADYSMRYGQTQSGPPSIVSTVKINQAGFTEMMDTEAMFQKWFKQARAAHLLP